MWPAPGSRIPSENGVVARLSGAAPPTHVTVHRAKTHRRVSSGGESLLSRRAYEGGQLSHRPSGAGTIRRLVLFGPPSRMDFEEWFVSGSEPVVDLSRRWARNCPLPGDV